jgi:hypothetical protein
MSKKDDVFNFRMQVFDLVKEHFLEKDPSFKFIIKHSGLEKRIRLKSIKSDLTPFLKKHSLCFRVLINKSKSPCIHSDVFTFIQTLFNILKEQNIEEHINNLEIVKSYLKLVEIDIH